MVIKPLGEKILVKRLEAEGKTAGGILLPDSAKEKPQQGTVVATGPGKLLDDGGRAEPVVKKGDTILYAKYGGTEIEHGGKDLLILKESDILAKME